jgi:hypothetical protein
MDVLELLEWRSSVLEAVKKHFAWRRVTSERLMGWIQKFPGMGDVAAAASVGR